MVTISEIEKEFDEFMLDEWGKWRIGRAEAKNFYRTKIKELLEGMVVERQEHAPNCDNPNDLESCTCEAGYYDIARAEQLNRVKKMSE